MDISSSFHDPALCRALLDRLSEELDSLGRGVRFMEVCGTHTVSIFRSGLRSLLPAGLEHLSGPGCPVCVTHDSEVAAFIRAAEKPNVIVATFGDLLRVPGPDGRSLKPAMAEGARVQVVYSPLDAVKIASEHPGDTVVFPAVGFETTAPVIAGALMSARSMELSNFCIIPCNKLVPPAMRALLEKDDALTEKYSVLFHSITVECPPIRRGQRNVRTLLIEKDHSAPRLTPGTRFKFTAHANIIISYEVIAPSPVKEEGSGGPAVISTQNNKE